ncbi:MAG: carbon-nitrogen hydrolase [Nitrososphaerota archaeon]
MKHIIGLIQMSMSERVSDNLRKAVSMIREAAERGANIICLPELFLTRYFPQIDSGKPPHWERIPGEVTRTLSEVARKSEVILISGSICEYVDKRFYNTSLIFDSNGRLLGKYRKMHLPQDECFYEKNYFSPGNLGYRVFKTRIGNIGVSICYDQWFPEVARINALMGADIIFYPSAIGTVDGIEQDEGDWKEAWINVQRGHAIANATIVAAVNRTGKEGRINFWGSSFICDAFGKILAMAKEDEEILLAEVDFEHNRKVRTGWGFLENRRPSTYKRLLKK